jgi:hypothetical protein
MYIQIKKPWMSHELRFVHVQRSAKLLRIGDKLSASTSQNYLCQTFVEYLFCTVHLNQI